MKYLAIPLCLIAAVAFAQTPSMPMQPTVRRVQPPSDATVQVLPENYLLKIVGMNKDRQISEFTMVVATTSFDANQLDGKLNIRASLEPETDGNSALLRYTLSTTIEIPQQVTTTPGPQGAQPEKVTVFNHRDCAVSSAVRLRLGEPVQVLKSGDETYTITLSRLAEGGKKGK